MCGGDKQRTDFKGAKRRIKLSESLMSSREMTLLEVTAQGVVTDYAC